MHVSQDSAMIRSMKEQPVFVGPLSAVDRMVRDARVGHLVTLINNQEMIETPSDILPGRHLRLAMNDILEAQPGLVPPGEKHVAELIDFVTSWDRQAPVLIHCWAGVSRSTAAALITLCALNPGVDEGHIARLLRVASPTATPNRRLVELADAALGRSGRLTNAVDAIGRGKMTMEADPFALPSRIAA